MHEERYTQLTKALSHMLPVLIDKYQPEQIILFGSMVSGNVHEWSDLDLAIVMDTPLPFLQRLKHAALSCRAPVGVNFLIYTPDEWDRMVADKHYFVVNEIISKGEVLYERQPREQHNGAVLTLYAPLRSPSLAYTLNKKLQISPSCTM